MNLYFFGSRKCFTRTNNDQYLGTKVNVNLQFLPKEYTSNTVKFDTLKSEHFGQSNCNYRVIIKVY